MSKEMKKLFFALILLSACTAHDIQPYQYEVKMTIEYETGDVHDDLISVESFSLPKSSGDLVTVRDGCLQQIYRQKSLICGVSKYYVSSYIRVK